MDCCNYVQPYATAGHHHYYQHHHQQHQQQQLHQQQQQQQYHQQQQQLQHQHQQQMHQHQQLSQQQQQYCYDASNAYAPAYNNAIEARYNCRLPPAYPSDYVYNPKEARLRKAMREQNRSQPPNNPVSSRLTTTSSSNNNHQQQQQQQQPVSPLPGGVSTSTSSNRIIGPWFPLGHTGSAPHPQPAAAAPATHPKPILSPRVMAAHQRTLDKTKDVIRKQLQDCNTGAFPTMPSASYPTSNGAQENSSDYCSNDFAEGQQQKWHPYQNGVNAYHSRGAFMSKMNSLHRGMQNPTPHPSSAWGQFCNVPFPTNQGVMQQHQQQQRSNRHMVYLQEQQQQQQSQNRHCGYPTAEIQMSYEAKMQEDLNRRLHSSYSQEELQQQPQQVKNPLVELQLSHLAQEESKTEETAPRWSTTTTPMTPRPPSSNSSCTPDGLLESESSQSTTQQHHQPSKQPLPGFQQAFGSTEIGRFSRSELFASLVEAVNVSSSKSSEDQISQFETTTTSPGCRSSSPDYNGYNGRVSPILNSSHTWHSPYAGAIGSEI